MFKKCTSGTIKIFTEIAEYFSKAVKIIAIAVNILVIPDKFFHGR